MKQIISIAYCLIVLSLTACSVSVDYTTLDFDATESAKTFELTVIGLVEWSIACDKSWVSINPDHDKVSQTVTVTVNRTGLDPGDYEALITIST